MESTTQMQVNSTKSTLFRVQPKKNWREEHNKKTKLNQYSDLQASGPTFHVDWPTKDSHSKLRSLASWAVLFLPAALNFF